MLLQAAPANLSPTGRPYLPSPRRGSRAAEIRFPRLALLSPQPCLVLAPGRKGSCQAWGMGPAGEPAGLAPAGGLLRASAWARRPPGDGVCHPGVLGTGEAVVRRGRLCHAPTPARDKAQISTD